MDPDRFSALGAESAARQRHAALANGVLLGALASANFAALLLVPLAVQSHALWGLLLVPAALSTCTLWPLIHEAIHGLLFRERRRNDAAGRLLAAAFGAPLRLLRAGHLLHHRYSRTVRERTEVFDPRTTSRPEAACLYFLRLLGGMYWLELVGGLAALLPSRVLASLSRRLESNAGIGHLVMNIVRERAALRETRQDALAILALLLLAFVLYGHRWWMLATMLQARAFLVSFSDNAYHYETPLDVPREAKNLRAPRWLELALLNFPLHGTHHLHPGLPWWALRARFDSDGACYQDGYFRGLTRQLRGPIELTRLAYGTHPGTPRRVEGRARRS